MIDFLHEEAVALNGAFSQYDMKTIYPALQRVPKNGLYLEVGVMDGRSLLFARKWSKGRVVGIDRQRYVDFDDIFKDYKNWEFIHATSNEAVKNWTKPIDLLFIDGDHSYEGVKDDWENFSPFVKKGGWIYFHDADDTSPGVLRLTTELGATHSDNQRCSMAWIQK